MKNMHYFGDFIILLHLPSKILYFALLEMLQVVFHRWLLVYANNEFPFNKSFPLSGNPSFSEEILNHALKNFWNSSPNLRKRFSQIALAKPRKKLNDLKFMTF